MSWYYLYSPNPNGSLDVRALLCQEAYSHVLGCEENTVLATCDVGHKKAAIVLKVVKPFFISDEYIRVVFHSGDLIATWAQEDLHG